MEEICYQLVIEETVGSLSDPCNVLAVPTNGP